MVTCHSLPAATLSATIIPHPAAATTHLWLAGNEGMETNMETTIMGYIGNTIRIHSFTPT